MNFLHVVLMTVIAVVAIPAGRVYGHEKVCHIPEVKHGQILEGKSEFMSGGEASIDCDPGYRPLGNARLRCLDGKWAENPPFCLEIRCEKLPELRNGEIRPNGSVLPRQHVTPVCNGGYRLIGPTRINCTDDGTFEPYEMLLCLEITCIPLPTLMNGRIGPSGSLLPGQNVTFTCDDGFILIGPSNFSCTDNGTYKPYQMPQCLRNETSEPEKRGMCQEPEKCVMSVGCIITIVLCIVFGIGCVGLTVQQLIYRRRIRDMDAKRDRATGDIEKDDSHQPLTVTGVDTMNYVHTEQACDFSADPRISADWIAAETISEIRPDSLRKSDDYKGGEV